MFDTCLCLEFKIAYLRSLNAAYVSIGMVHLRLYGCRLAYEIWKLFEIEMTRVQSLCGAIRLAKSAVCTGTHTRCVHTPDVYTHQMCTHTRCVHMDVAFVKG